MSDSFPNTKMAVSDPLDAAEIFFTNLLLLGFDPAAMERKYRIPFNKDMFALPNKKGFEAVARFLFSRLDEARCQEEFRDCWLISDKKEEQMFRKVCNNWLVQIAKDDPQSFLPRIVSSLFMSPGGEKFIQFLLCFSRYVLHRTMMQENGAKSVKDFLGHPVLTRENVVMAPVMASGIMAGSIRQRQKFLQVVQDSVYVQQEWNNYAHELIKDYRQKVKRARDLEREVNEEKQKLVERVAASSSPSRTKQRSGTTDYDFGILAVRRAQLIQQVRSMWKVFDDFHSLHLVDREIIDSILNGSLDKYRIDESELNIKIPDLLLRRCEHELQRRNVDNIYQGGQVNLLSLIHLWNLSLHLYAEKLHEAGVPKLDTAVPAVTTMVEIHRAHSANSDDLRQRLELNFLPDLKQSIEYLKRELDRDLLSTVSPASLRITNLGLGLMPPTPPVSFEPRETNPSGNEPSATSRLLRIGQNHVTTPDGASQLIRDVNDKVQSQHAGLVQGIPIYAPTNQIHGFDKLRPTGIDSRSTAFVQNTKAKTTVAKGQPVQISTTRLPVSHVKGDTKQKTMTANQLLPSQTTKPVTTRESKTLNNKFAKPLAANAKSGTTKKSVGPVRPVIPKVDRHFEVKMLSKQVPSSSLDVLASKIAESVCLDLPEFKENSGKNSPDDIYYVDAFSSRDKLEHTPPSTRHSIWHDGLLNDSIGPLSSTHIESPLRFSIDRGEIDQVAVKLFSADPLDDDEGRLTPVINNGKSSVVKMPYNPLAYRPQLDTGSPVSARTPSTICSPSPESDDDVEEIPMADEEMKVKNTGLVSDDEEEYIVDAKTGAGWRHTSSVQGFQEGMENLGEEEMSVEEDNQDREHIYKNGTGDLNLLGDSSRDEVIQTSSGNREGRNSRTSEKAVSLEAVGLARQQKEFATAKELHEAMEVNKSYEGDSLTIMSETLQFLQDTKTPCLPNRVKRLAGLQSTRNYNEITVEKIVHENDSNRSIAASEPDLKRNLSVDVHHSLPLELNKPRVVASEASFDKGSISCRDFRVGHQSKNIKMANPLLQTESSILRSNKNLPLHTNFAEAVDLTDASGGDHGRSSDVSRQKSQISSPALESSSSKMNSLIQHYKNLRSQQNADSSLRNSSRNKQNTSVTIEASEALQNSYFDSHTSSRLPSNSFSGGDMHSLHQLDGSFKTLTNSVERTKFIQDENFDDLKQMLLDTSLSATPFVRSSKRFSFSRGDRLAPSPLTDAVHSTNVSFARANDSLVNLLDFDDSILVPSSPPNANVVAVAVGELIDFS